MVERLTRKLNECNVINSQRKEIAKLKEFNEDH